MTNVRLLCGVVALALSSSAAAQADRAGEMLSKEKDTCQRMYDQQMRMMCNSPAQANSRDRCLEDAEARKSNCLSRAQARYDQAMRRR